MPPTRHQEGDRAARRGWAEARASGTCHHREGAGDNITVDPVFLIVDSSAIQANAFGGAGGKVRN